MINDGFLDEGGEADLAATLGLSGRHLRRLFWQAVGATPTQVAISRRAHFARLLLDDTDLTVTDIAFAARFGSLRRMNEVMRSTFGFSPTELRAKTARGDRCSVDGGIRLRINVYRAHDFEAYLRDLDDRAVPGVESVAGGVYRRATNVCGFPGVVEVRSPRSGTIDILAHVPALAGLIDTVARCRRVFRLDHDSDGRPGNWSHFEATVVETLRRGCEDSQPALQELVERFGAAVPGAAHLGVTHQFPDPVNLLQLDGNLAGLDQDVERAVVDIARRAIQATTGTPTSRTA